MIAIIDYGIGNLYSVSKAVERLGYVAKITSDRDEIMSSQGAILPGVGAFGDAMAHLRDAHLYDTVIDFAKSGHYLLGICLGMQMLFTSSEEHGHHQGLNLLPGKVIRFQGNYKVPHMGWNQLEFIQDHPLLQDLTAGHVYFVHSYHVMPELSSDLLAVTDYHHAVAAIVARNHIFGMQFHPEKSGTLGMQLLSRFLSLCHTSITES